MNTDYLVLADAATSAEGKLYIHGAGWDSITTTSFPFSHPALAVGIQLRVPWTDTNTPHRIELDIVDEDGQSIIQPPAQPINGTIHVGRPPIIPRGEDQIVTLAITYRDVAFEKRGAYALVLRIDGMEDARAPFRILDLRPTT